MTDRPYALTISGPSAHIYPLAESLGFSDVMEALSLSVFEDDPQNARVEALYETQGEAAAALALLTLPDGVNAAITQTADEDWVSLSQQGLAPVEAGRFWLYGSHDADKTPPEGAHAILVDAGLAFGTGHHGTTKGCLIIFDDLLTAGFTPKTVLDLGCGAGTLAIAAAMALPADTDILATDIDQDAVDVTLDNAGFNKVTGRITAERADGFDAPIFAGKQFDLVFANILAGPLMGLADDITAAMAPGGRVILSGIVDEMAERVTARFTQSGLTVTPQPSLEGWTSLLAVKPA
ncbi:MAG: 50S ribosomal protein L11 methyltransferase [Maricaulaceae bacterium]